MIFEYSIRINFMLKQNIMLLQEAHKKQQYYTISGCGDEPSVRIAAEAPSGSRTMAAGISGRSSRETRDDHQELPAAVVQFPTLPS